MEQVLVRAQAQVSSVAQSIASKLQEFKEIEVSAMGPEANNNAVKGLAAAKELLKCDFPCFISFRTVDTGNGRRTTMIYRAVLQSGTSGNMDQVAPTQSGAK